MALLTSIPPITKDDKVLGQHEEMEISRTNNSKRCDTETGVSVDQQTPSQILVETPTKRRSDVPTPCPARGSDIRPCAPVDSQITAHPNPRIRDLLMEGGSLSPKAADCDRDGSSRTGARGGTKRDGTELAKASRRNSGTSSDDSSSSNMEISRAGNTSSDAESLVGVEEKKEAAIKSKTKGKGVFGANIGQEKTITIDGKEGSPSARMHLLQQQPEDKKPAPAPVAVDVTCASSDHPFHEEEEPAALLLTEEQDRAFVKEIFKNGLDIAAPSTIAPFMKNVPADLVGEKKFKDILKSHLQKFRLAPKYESNVESFMEEFDSFKTKLKTEENKAAAKPARGQGHQVDSDADTNTAESPPPVVALEVSASRATLDAVLGTTDPDQLIGGSAAAYVSAKVMNNVSPRKYVGRALQAPRLTDAEKKTDTGKQLMRVTAFLDFLGEYILKSRQGFDMKLDHDSPPFLLPGDSFELEEDAEEEENRGESLVRQPSTAAAVPARIPAPSNNYRQHFDHHPRREQDVAARQSTLAVAHHMNYQLDGYHLPNQYRAGLQEQYLPPEAAVSNDITPYYANHLLSRQLMDTHYHHTPTGHVGTTYDVASAYQYWSANSYDPGGGHVRNGWTPRHNPLLGRHVGGVTTSWSLPPPRQSHLENPVVLPPRPDQATSGRLDAAEHLEPGFHHAHRDNSGGASVFVQPPLLVVAPPAAALGPVDVARRLHHDDRLVHATPPEPAHWRDAYGLQPLDVAHDFQHDFHGSHLDPSDVVRVTEVLQRTLDRPDPIRSAPTTYYQGPVTEEPSRAPQDSHGRRTRTYDESFDGGRHDRPPMRRRRH